ncbi:mannose-6-phosphate isomerase type II [Ruegeria sp. TM1040]|uniref:mannose-6-phosphate isomerase n=1 Tax=Ruegeria sp. (strain TM1040) TaxID=292414 RepID=UPI000046270A|nr:mannose-6-phosphate isomerase [Ruegeria sp. TM1040]ABF63692.1 mannose-6-phosphate isomerase type II [Ruegeria sp. TM1040]
MLHPIILAGGVTQTSEWSTGVCHLALETAPGVPSRFEGVLDAMSGDVFADPVVVTTRDNMSLVERQIAARPAALIVEPETHKPAAALLSAVLSLRHMPGALVVVAPATANLADTRNLDKALCNAIPAAQRGEIVMFGQRTTRAYGGFGIMEVVTQPHENAPVAVSRVLASGRKVTLSHLLHGNHQLWGTGLYLARVDVLLAAFKSHASRLFLPVKNALLRAGTVDRTTLLDRATYRRVKAITFEKAVAEKIENICAIQLDPTWSALEEWDQDAAADSAVAQWDEDLAQERAGVLNARAAAPFPHSADMMAVYASLSKISAEDALSAHATEYDWGRLESLAMGPGFTLQRMSIAPGATLDLNAAPGGAEHWIVAQGSVLITIGDHVRLVWEGHSARIPAGRSRRIENPGSGTLVLVQLQVMPLSATGQPQSAASFSPAGVA